MENNQKSAAVVLNGERYLGSIVADTIVGVDGGYDKVCNADIFVGDRDSVKSEILAKKQILLNVDKDTTDGEYAVNYLLANGYKKIDFYGLIGGRIDHILANLGIMALCVQNGVQARAICNDCDIYMTNSDLQIDVPKNCTISLSPFSDKVHIISLEGVKWSIFDQTIFKTSSRTVSNLSTSNKIQLCVDFGIVMVIVNK